MLQSHSLLSQQYRTKTVMLDPYHFDQGPSYKYVKRVYEQSFD